MSLVASHQLAVASALSLRATTPGSVGRTQCSLAGRSLALRKQLSGTGTGMGMTLRQNVSGTGMGTGSGSGTGTGTGTGRSLRLQCRAYSVEVEHNGTVTTLEVPEDESILSVALDAGMDLPYDCKLGVCMTCPAKIERGSVDQSEGMLSDDVQEAGYALMCAAYPRSDCKIRVIPEEELLSLQLMTS